MIFLPTIGIPIMFSSNYCYIVDGKTIFVIITKFKCTTTNSSQCSGSWRIDLFNIREIYSLDDYEKYVFYRGLNKKNDGQRAFPCTRILRAYYPCIYFIFLRPRYRELHNIFYNVYTPYYKIMGWDSKCSLQFFLKYLFVSIF